MTGLDTSIIFLYLAMMIGLGFYANRKQKGVEDYFLAGQRQNTFSIACLWMASWVGGEACSGYFAEVFELVQRAV